MPKSTSSASTVTKAKAKVQIPKQPIKPTISKTEKKKLVSSTAKELKEAKKLVASKTKELEKAKKAAIRKTSSDKKEEKKKKKESRPVDKAEILAKANALIGKIESLLAQ